MMNITKTFNTNNTTTFTNGSEINNKPVYNKIQKGKRFLLDAGITKSGKNSYQKYTYLELADIEPHIIKFMEQENMTSRFNFTETVATLIIRDEDSQTEAYYTLPLPQVQETDARKAMQEIGACLTYSMRYLFIMAFEIVVTDQIDKTPVKQYKQKKHNKKQEQPQDPYTSNGREQTRLEQRPITLDQKVRQIQQELISEGKNRFNKTYIKEKIDQKYQEDEKTRKELYQKFKLSEGVNTGQVKGKYTTY